MSAPVVINEFDASLLISALTGDSFAASGRREFLSYRDLGLNEATNGKVGAAISRIQGDPGDMSTGWHYHICELQMFYIIKGYVDIEFEDTGVMRLEAGTCVSIPPGRLHNELAVSSDNEILEVTIPPQIGTVTVPDFRP